MAKNKVKIDVEVDDKGTTRKVGLGAKKAADGLEKTGEAAHTTDRRLKGASQQSSNTTKNFSKMAQGITGGLVPAYATLATNLFAVSAAFQFLRRAASFDILVRSQEQYFQATGKNLSGITKQLRDASGGMLDFNTAAQATSLGLASGIGAGQLEKIVIGAKKASQVLGRDFTDAVNRLVTGLAKTEPEVLDELGLSAVKVGRANREFAQALNKSESALTDYEKKQAFVTLGLKELERIYGSIEAQTNPFDELRVTFDDLIKKLTTELLPGFQMFADFLNNNVERAGMIFALFAAGIAKSALNLQGLVSGLDGFATRMKSINSGAFSGLKGAFADFQDQRGATAKIAGVQDKSLMRTLQGKDVSKSKILQKTQAGGIASLGVLDKKTLKKALKAAEAEYKKHGKITKGIFAGMSMDIVTQFKGAMVSNERAAKVSTTKTGGFFRIMFSGIKLGFTGILTAGTFTFRALGTAAKVGLGWIGRVIELATWIATFVLFKDAASEALTKVSTLAENVFGAIDSIIDFFRRSLLKLFPILEKIPGMQDKFTGFKDSFNSPDGILSGARRFTEEIEASAVAAKETRDALQAATKKKEGDEAANEAMKRAAVRFHQETGATSARDEALITALIPALENIASRMEKTNTVQLPDKFVAGFRVPGEKFTTSVPLSAAEQSAEVAKMLMGITGQGVGQIDPAKQRLSAEEALRNPATRVGNDVVKQIQELTRLNNSLTALVDVPKRQAAAAANIGIPGGAEGVGIAQSTLEGAGIMLQGKKMEQAGLTAEGTGTGGLSGAFAEQAQKDLAVQKEKLAIDIQSLENFQARQILMQNKSQMDAVEFQAQVDKLDLLDQELVKREKLSKDAEFRATELGQLGLTLGATLESSLTKGIQGLVDGTMSAKDAFKSMAKSILADIAQMIAKMLVMKALEASLGGTGFGDFLGIGKRNGGVVEQARYGRMGGFSAGGIARGKDAGYPVMLHGTEAVVPLPNGKAIPVEMKRGAGGDTNNISVNISSDTSSAQVTQSGTGAQQDAATQAKLGRQIAGAVQEELIRQKRPGGILSPYGAAG